MTAIQDTAREIAERVTVTLKVTSALGVTLSTESALAQILNDLMQDATDARTRGGRWARESTSEEIDAALWRGSIARDTLDNTSRPSTGPVGDYVRALLNA